MEAIRQILEEERETSNLNALSLKSTYDFRNQYLMGSNEIHKILKYTVEDSQRQSCQPQQVLHDL